MGLCDAVYAWLRDTVCDGVRVTDDEYVGVRVVEVDRVELSVAVGDPLGDPEEDTEAVSERV